MIKNRLVLTPDAHIKKTYFELYLDKINNFGHVCFFCSC